MQTSTESVILHYDLVGDDSHDPILFVHGFPLAGEMWRPAAERICGDGWRCVLPDLRGHGRSDTTAEASIRAYADDLAHLLDNLGETQPAVVCGLSMGGVITLEFYRRYPHRVRGMVLCDCRATPETPEGRDERRAVAQRVLDEGNGPLAEQMIAKLFAPGADRTLRDYWQERIAATNPIGVITALKALAERPDAVPTLATINVPTLLVFGTRDVISPPEVGRQMQAAIPNSRLDLVSDAGHLPPLEQPDVFADALRRFLAEVRESE
ncbi:alpha/beta fold hydrolase [uncultured Ilyobacter sp.]|uniref:alpha/beta fold hydrolase n=1 Tax=uncultured Ilyobacter sp. TaxID=544433 RepID=UPI0029F47FF0|nr:alpha/beta fold hydrolase [uncultured Ilyobacter sp.]